jgi:hypothetical protein
LKSKNTYYYGTPSKVEHLLSEYEFLGIYAQKIAGGLMVPAMQPKAEKKKDGSWGWSFIKDRDVKKKPAPRAKRREDEDEDKPKQDRSQRSKNR